MHPNVHLLPGVKLINKYIIFQGLTATFNAFGRHFIQRDLHFLGIEHTTHLKSAKKNQNGPFLFIYFFQNIAVFILNYLCIFLQFVCPCNLSLKGHLSSFKKLFNLDIHHNRKDKMIAASVASKTFAP